MVLIRNVFFIFLILFLFIAVGFFLLITLVNPNQFKPFLIHQVKQRTGYELSLNRLSWSIYPKIAINAQDVKLIAPHQPQAFFEAKKLLLDVELSALIKGEKKFQGLISIPVAQLFSLTVTEVKAKLNWQANQLSLQDIFAKLYDGELAAKMSGSELLTHPKWRGSLTLKHVAIQSLLKQVYGETLKLTLAGELNLVLSLRTQGTIKSAILAYLNGEGHFNITQGELVGIDLNYFVAAAQALLKHQPLPPILHQHTAFDTMTGSVNIKDGTLHNPDLLFASSAFSVRGKGNIFLVSQTLDYELAALFKENPAWDIPLTIRGSIQKPSVQLNHTLLQQIFLKEKLKSVKEKIREEIKKMPEKSQHFLKSLLGH